METAEWTLEEQGKIQKIEDFLVTWPGAEWGPAHIVLSDYNLESDFIEFCLNIIDNSYVSGNYSIPHTPEELQATRTLLLELLENGEDSL